MAAISGSIRTRSPPRAVRQAETEGRPQCFTSIHGSSTPISLESPGWAADPIPPLHRPEHTAPRFERLLKEFRFGTLSDAASRLPKIPLFRRQETGLVRVDDELDSNDAPLRELERVLHEHPVPDAPFPAPADTQQRPQRSFHLLKFLANGRQVHLGTFVDEPTSESSILAVRELTVKAEIVPVGPLRWLNGLSVRGVRRLGDGRPVSKPPAWSKPSVHGRPKPNSNCGIAFCSSMAPVLGTAADLEENRPILSTGQRKVPPIRRDGTPAEKPSVFA